MEASQQLQSTSQISSQSMLPNFIDSVFVQDTRNVKSIINSAKHGIDNLRLEENPESGSVIHLPSKTQFKTIQKLLEEYYCVDEPRLESHEQYLEMK